MSIAEGVLIGRGERYNLWAIGEGPNRSSLKKRHSCHQSPPPEERRRPAPGHSWESCGGAPPGNTITISEKAFLCPPNVRRGGRGGCSKELVCSRRVRDFYIKNIHFERDFLYGHVSTTTADDTMPTIKEICASCGKSEGVPLVWGDPDLLDKSDQDMIGRGEMFCGGDAITIDEQNRPMNWACLACGVQWVSCRANEDYAGEA